MRGTNYTMTKKGKQYFRLSMDKFSIPNVIVRYLYAFVFRIITIAESGVQHKKINKIKSNIQML